MTPEQLEFLSKITEKKLAAYENVRIANLHSRGKKRRLRVTNPISTIPLEELTNPSISKDSLFEKYNVSKRTIDAYRKEHDIRTIWVPRRHVPMEDRIPLQELQDTSITAGTLSIKYNVDRGMISTWRKERGIRYTGKKKK